MAKKKLDWKPAGKNLQQVSEMLKGTYGRKIVVGDASVGRGDTHREVGEKWTDSEGYEWEQKQGYRMKISKTPSIGMFPHQCKDCKKNCTTSFDKETPIDNKCSLKKIKKADIINIGNSFLGSQQQLPPIYSAIKIDGEKLYNKARRGEYIKAMPRQIEIKKFNITNITIPFIQCEICCSKGTYIRSIANDFGKKLNVFAHLHQLKRDSIGKYKLENAINLEDFLIQLN